MYKLNQINVNEIDLKFSFERTSSFGYFNLNCSQILSKHRYKFWIHEKNCKNMSSYEQNLSKTCPLHRRQITKKLFIWTLDYQKWNFRKKNLAPFAKVESSHNLLYNTNEKQKQWLTGITWRWSHANGNIMLVEVFIDRWKDKQEVMWLTFSSGHKHERYKIIKLSLTPIQKIRNNISSISPKNVCFI